MDNGTREFVDNKIVSGIPSKNAGRYMVNNGRRHGRDGGRDVKNVGPWAEFQWLLWAFDRATVVAGRCQDGYKS